MTSDLEKRGFLEQYLRFQISLAELRVSLGPGWRFERKGDDYDLAGEPSSYEPIPFDVEDVRRAIRLAATDAIPVAFLQDWANLLILSDIYEPASHLVDDDRETLLTCLHELASASIFNGLGREELLKLQARLPPRRSPG
jgi:hypothetical protein